MNRSQGLPGVLTLTFALALGCTDRTGAGDAIEQHNANETSEAEDGGNTPSSPPSSDDESQQPTPEPTSEHDASAAEPPASMQPEPGAVPSADSGPDLTGQAMPAPPGSTTGEPLPVASSAEPAPPSSEPVVNPDPSTPAVPSASVSCGDACTAECPCEPPLSAEEVCNACSQDTRCIQYPREDGEWEYLCAAWTPCESARACACFDPAFGYCERLSGDATGICVCTGPEPIPADDACDCESDEQCIYQAGGPGPGGYACVMQEPYPCAEDDVCGCLDAQGSCEWDASTMLCRCDNGLD